MKRIWLLVAIVLLACMAWQLQRPAPAVVANEGQNPALVEQPEIPSASPHLSTPANPELGLPTPQATALDPGADPSHALEQSLLTDDALTAQDAIADPRFDLIVTGLAREAGAQAREKARFARASLAAALRKDPRFTVEMFACTARICAGTVSGRGVDKPEDFEDLLFTASNKPNMYATQLAYDARRGHPGDFDYRLIFTTDPALNAITVPPGDSAQAEQSTP